MAAAVQCGALPAASGRAFRAPRAGRRSLRVCANVGEGCGCGLSLRSSARFCLLSLLSPPPLPCPAARSHRRCARAEEPGDHAQVLGAVCPEVRGGAAGGCGGRRAGRGACLRCPHRAARSWTPQVVPLHPQLGSLPLHGVLRRTGTFFCVDKSVTAVVIKGLAEHKDELGAPLCPCRHYDDKAAEAEQGFWNCPCVPMRERKVRARTRGAAA